MLQSLSVLQHDGAPRHLDLRVKELINVKLRNKYICWKRWMIFFWPTPAPDLTPLDFFLLGHVKSNVNSTEPRSLEDRIARKNNNYRLVINCINENQLENVFEQVKNRVTHSVSNEGGHVEK